VLFIGSSVMMVVTSARLSFFVIIAIPVIVLPLVAFGRLVRRRSRTAQDTLADASAYAAIMYRRVGQRGSALGAVARSDSLTHRCGIDTPALRQAAEPIPLTDREREITRLIAQGFSSRDVAEKLTLSVRTVEGHIYRAMTKTGTTTRAELATLLTDRPRDEG